MASSRSNDIERICREAGSRKQSEGNPISETEPTNEANNSGDPSHIESYYTANWGPVMIQYIDAALISCPCEVADRHIMMKIILYGIQPLVVRRYKDGYMVLDGIKRYNAALLLGHTVLPCIVKICTDEQAADFIKLGKIINQIVSRKRKECKEDDWII